MIGYEIFQNLKKMYQAERKFKILFCPYKEDMWDSFETIYEAALLDKDTIAKIMPIPYFTLSNLLPCSAIMEFGDLSRNFPNILNDEWDVIMIHYPYDNKNNVTRPMLTSAMLKFFCKHLVFINYAVIGDRDVEPQAAGYPAYKNVELIICEKEKHAKQLKEMLGGVNPNIKCVAWGSPKFDKLTCEYAMPKEWEKKTKGKKVILLQTSLIPFMNNPHKLEQIEEFLNKYFNDESVCIWWRPHPLLADTIIAHRPEQFEHYTNLLDKVEHSRHILDLTSNLHRAISMTDELVSDKSSVVILYQSTGKPITMLGD